MWKIVTVEYFDDWFLGLDTSASEKNILKRSKEIVNHLKVDDTPVYDLDVGFLKDFRTEDAVKDALQRLQASKKRIKEYFFWYHRNKDCNFYIYFRFFLWYK